jgi:hypothetical protein
MKTLLLTGLLALLLTGTAIAVWAQEDPFYGWPTGCDAGTLDAIEDASPNVDYRALCNEFLACASAGRAVNVCQFEASALLLEGCNANDVICRNEALIYATVLTIDLPPNDWSVATHVWGTGRGLVEPFTEVLRLYSEGEYEHASTRLEQFPDYAQLHEMYWYAAGLIFEARNLPQRALETYALSIQLGDMRYSPALFSHGLLLGELGRNTEASARLKSHLMSRQPTLLSAFSSLTEQYPLDMSQFSSWVAFPVMWKGGSPGGEMYSDLTLEQSFPVSIAHFPELELIAVIGFSDDASRNGASPDTAFTPQLLPRSPQGNVGGGIELPPIEGFRYHELYFDSGLDLFVRPDVIVATDSSTGFEAWSGNTYILLPAGSSDPRPSLGQRWCETGVISRLRSGMLVVNEDQGDLHPSRNPGEDLSDVAFTMPVLVSGEPVCVGSTLWWYAKDEEGHEGWIAENRDTHYLVLPASRDAGFLYCPSAPMSRLFEGAQARVTNEPGANYVRYDTYDSAEITQILPVRQIVEIAGGPYCVDNHVWWSIRSDDPYYAGYVREGEGDTYFLEPVPEVAP